MQLIFDRDRRPDVDLRDLQMSEWGIIALKFLYDWHARYANVDTSLLCHIGIYVVVTCQNLTVWSPIAAAIASILMYILTYTKYKHTVKLNFTSLG